MDLHELSLSQIQELISSGKTTSSEVFSYFQNRAKKLNPELNAFATIAEGVPTSRSGK